MAEAAGGPARPQRGRAKRHHYIPEMTQRRFAGPDLHLWSFDKRHPERGVERKPIARLFREWHLYTFVGTDGSRDTSSETLLSASEGRTEPILKRLVAEARGGRLHRPSTADRGILVDFLIAQLRRAPDFFDSVTPPQQVAADVATLFRQWEERYGPASDEERADLISGRLASRTRANLFARNVAQPLARSTAVMLERGLSVGVVGSGDRSFLLGSNPFARFLGLTSRRNGLADPGAEAWLPIASDVAVLSFGSRAQEHLRHLPDEAVRKINSVIAAQSTVVASASRDLVASFARRHLKSRLVPPRH
ncbi:DUF4238 domain-containing protein [Methylobacterium sp. J-026]|uniref:DUF4238 domain-containing protein n=1 Tax=Methylobacterium sp. J-026 TaxID=2836624 RepID=UPI001FB8CD97|nr:DUF4238 domain-containing protein [Methylobacterium sp. J-026]MCJ2133301.1 DUF4238 domain-containing protein [Methylobacterium sp. J-026]